MLFSEKPAFNPFDTPLKCLLSAALFSIIPYFIFVFPHFQFDRNLWICMGVLLFFSTFTFHIFHHNKYLVDNYSEKIENSKREAGSHSWPWYQLAYPLSEKTFWNKKRIPKYGIPLFISSKLMIIWSILSIAFWNKF